MKIERLLFALCFMTLVASVASADGPNVQTLMKDGVGNYLADGKGMTLYWFTKDSPGKSACAGPCVERWPLFSADATTPGSGLMAADFGSITREDGKAQTTFRGYPLYYWVKDMAKGDTGGQGVNNVWYVVDPGNFPPKK